jgi:colanic acid/amylovoran biosynthesis glycosyltransferase
MLSSKKIIGALITIACMVVTLESRPLNVIFVVAYFPAPSQTYILNIMTGLIDKGHNVTIFALRKNDVEGQPNIAKYGLMDHVIYEQWPSEMPECDVIFCQSASLGRKMIGNESIAKWMQDKKLVVCLRGLDITGNAIKKDPSIYYDLFARGDLFLPVCDYFKNLLIGYGCDPQKIMVHHSAIDCEKFAFRERKKDNRKQAKTHLVAVGRLIQKKGLDIAIKSLAKIAKNPKYNIHFTIVGSGHLRKNLEKLAVELGIRNKISFFGWATQEQIVDILHRSHVFLLPSTKSDKGDEEGIANALKEAMSTGLVSIGTWHAGTPELIEDGISGYLVPEKNSRALAERIKHVIKHPELWKTIGLAARQKIEDEFETKKSVEELEQLFYGLVGEAQL